MKLKKSAQNNSEADFEFSFYDDIDDALIEGLEQNQDFFTLLLNNEELKRSVLGIFSGEIYKALRQNEASEKNIIYEYSAPMGKVAEDLPVYDEKKQG